MSQQEDPVRGRGPTSSAHEPAATTPLGTAPAEWTKAPDRRTGRKVWQITDGPRPSHFCYQTVQGFTADERFMVFASDRDEKGWQLWRADLETGELARLTDQEELRHGSYGMHPNGRQVCVSSGWRYLAVEVGTGRTRVLADLEGELPGPPGGAELPISADGTRLLVPYGGDDRRKSSAAVVWLDEGRVEPVLDWEGGWLCHYQFCPAEPDWVIFDPLPDPQNDMTKSLQERARAWLLDIHSREVRPFLMAPRGTRATHEYWGPDGERLYFHHKTQPGWVPTSLSSIDRFGRDWQTHYTHETLKLGHSDISRDERWIVTDVQEPGENPLLLVDVETGRAETLCWPNSSVEEGHTKHSHVHPSFSPGDRYVGFTSDRTGVAQVYVVPLDR